MTPTTIAVDFDGVIHKYSKGWQDGTIYDDPMPGVAAALSHYMARGWEIVIFSTRNYDRVSRGKFVKNQVAEMAVWLEKHKVPFTRIHTEPCKPICKLFIDDNAYRFEGDWDTETILKIERLVTTKFPRS